MTVANDVEALIARKPNVTEAEMANTLFGGAGYQQRVNSTCRRLLAEGRIQRRGQGGPSDPYRYVIRGTK